MNIEYLRNFVKLTEYKSFSDLAGDLPITQSSLSHQISQLEKELGIKLIERSTKKFKITEAGTLFLNHARKIVESYEEALSEISHLKNKEYETIIISASSIPGSHILPKYIAEFRSLNPNINFKIVVNNSQKSIDSINKKLVDFAGIGSFLSFNREEYDTIQIGEDEFKFICAPNHELIKHENKPVKFEDILHFPFIWREKGSGMRDTFTLQFPDYKKLDMKLEVNDNDSIISTVNESNYLSIMSEIMAKKAEKAGLVKILQIHDYPVITKRPLFFIRRKNVSLSPLKNKFWEYVVKSSK